MPPRSKAETMPPAVKAWLDQALIASNFSGYDQLAAECKKRGVDISRSSLGRYGAQFEKSMTALKIATEQAQAIAEAVPDGENAMADALLRLVQEKAFSSLMEMENAGKISLDKLAKIATDTAFAGNAVKEFRSKVKTKAAEAAKAVSSIAKQAGLTSDQVAEIKRKILGIAQ